ncbi:PLxRFG domain-containing protein [Thermomonas sp. S9]|uniref:PLxRFG domain-containing protein n=1 Tax=Thermomonas sp. S9 TaxID=2885203 RepID=UPI00216B01FE|nr:PLxRFG domain-containing protein [Thermomonas sp. S9]
MERAKAEGFFWDSDHPILARLDTLPVLGGAEHRVFVVGSGDARFVIRATDNGFFGPRSDISPAQYLARLDDFNSTFPSLQTRLIGVSESADIPGHAVIWTAQPFVYGKKFSSQDALREGMVARGWQEDGYPGVPRYRHTASGAVIEDAHIDNVFHDEDGNLYPFDVVVAEMPTSGGLKFSRPDPEKTLEAMDARTVRGSVFDALRTWWNRGPISSAVENTRPAWLGALTLRHLAELGNDIHLKQVDAYAKRVQQMTTDRNALQEAGAKVADIWEKFQRTDRAGADATANLMHDATIAGVDPSQSYIPLMTGATKRGGNEAVTAESIARRIAMVDADLDADPSDQIRRGLVAERGELEALLAEEQARVQAYPELVRRYQALPEQGRQVYQSARQVYDDHSKALRDAIIARVKDSVESGDVRDAYIAQVRQTFEDARVRGPYFPLARFGEFWINAEKDGKPAFFMYENVQEWRAGQTDLARRGYVVKEAGRKIAEARSVAGVSSAFMADLEGVLKQSGADKQVMDNVWQMYLRTLPDLSMRKHFIHRKKVEGYSGDALRAFSGNVFHGSYQIARVRHSHKLVELLDSLKKATAALAGDDPERAAKAAALTTELGQRHEWVMNPKDSKAVSWLTSLGFVWYLGMTPAAAAVNLTQTAIVTFPVLASRFGVAKAWNTLAAATGRALRNVNGDLTRGLSDEERTAFEMWEKSGAIDRTMAHNLAGLSETDTRSYNPVARRGMELVSLMFHKAEVVNREATALAAFRLARSEGQDFHTAVQYAADVVTESHFDYCVDTETEALTLDGWKRYDQIKVGDVLLSVDESGRAVESTASAINVFAGEKQVIEFSSSRRFSMALTPNHDVVMQRHESGKGWGPVSKVQARDLKGSHHVLRSPLAAIDGRAGVYGRDLAALLGWISAEGWYAKFRNCKAKNDVRLSQSIKHNPAHVEEIRGILARIAPVHSEQKPAANGTITWTIGGDLRKRVLELMPDNLLTFDLFRTMTAEEMEALLDAFAKGDGHRRGAGCYTIDQADHGVQNLHVLQAMATALGRTATLTSNGKTMILMGGLRPSQRTIAKGLTRTERTVDTVWCPTTAHGTWIARRRGAVFVTGNSNANRARWMQSNAAKVFLLFRQYSLNMTWFLWRNFYLGTKGETPAVRKEARKKLAGVLGMTALFSGVMGLPLMGLMFDLANAAAALFGDDDDPFDAEVEFRNFLADLLGPDVARILTQGPMESLTGIEFGSRVGLNELWLRSPDRELEGQAMADYLLEQAAGPVVGGMLVNTLRGSKMIAEGNTWRGIETMAPKSVKDAMKALRYGKEGVNTMRGDPLIEDVGLHQTLMQLAGFTPAEVTEQYEANNAAKNYEQRILDRRKSLLNAYAMAWRAEDPDGIQKALAKIQKWNAKHPAMGITLDTIRRSLASRMRYIARAEGGIVLDRRIAEDAREQARFAE